MTEGLRKVICPVCGHSINERYKRDGETMIYLDDYLKSRYDFHRQYIGYEAKGGRGGLADQTELYPEDWPEGFEAIKKALLRGVQYYCFQSWLQVVDVTDVIIDPQQHIF